MILDEESSDRPFLDPAALKFFHSPENDVRVRMEIRDRQSYLEVRIARVLPLSEPVRYFGVRDSADKEIGVLLSLDGLDPDSRAVAEEELARRHFLPKVVRVVKVSDNHGVVVWDVETEHGSRKYVVRNMRDNTVALSSTRVLMTDVDGNRFEFPDISRLPVESQDIVMKAV
jgi:hypothetical protein